MIPQTKEAIQPAQIAKSVPADQPTRTWKLDFMTGRVAGQVDGRAAMEQAIYMILSTERFYYSIFSWNYGVELARAQDSFAEFESEIARVIKEALLADRRITAVHSFAVQKTGKRSALVTFTAETIFGEIEVERQVSL